MTQQTGKIEKGWGYELVWVNNLHYCGKILVFERKGARTSFLYHQNYTKSWFVNAGKFKFTFIDTKTGQSKEIILDEGRTVDISPLSPHKLESLEANSIIFEVGNPDHEEDRFRIQPGDTQILEQKSDPTS
jgi:mannose-6-phosphate isomerase-like protein (cupin superfamily)